MSANNHKLLEPRQREYSLDNAADKAAYDDMLNECAGEVRIGSLVFDPARIVEELDPIAYRCGFNDWADGGPDRWECPICGEIHDNEDAAKFCCQDEEA